ncbi:hypothetical protein FHS15_000498 [Paenibacillus castaneae]|uniref:hypothetical protein n=1 Tax=Paenibacillus castaneae TaxID=474957 RepID=UPI000C9CF8C1|nr:hypothetical protein [Paenibacillus castaneae]NIK75400.1 hypothetical protein [Paenibacillus castaneae]
MAIIDQLATSLNRKDEAPNQELAKNIADQADKNAVKELVDLLNHKDKNIQSDGIKVLYEIGELEPSLIADYSKELIALLDSKNNRLVWGAMTALDTITLITPSAIYSEIAKIIDIANMGSVITRDHGVGILIKLASTEQYAEHAFSLLVEQLKNCPTNQLPMYAENAVPIINDKNKTMFIDVLASRLSEIEKDSKRKRVEKVMKKLNA